MGVASHIQRVAHRRVDHANLDALTSRSANTQTFNMKLNGGNEFVMDPEQLIKGLWFCGQISGHLSVLLLRTQLSEHLHTLIKHPHLFVCFSRHSHPQTAKMQATISRATAVRPVASAQKVQKPQAKVRVRLRQCSNASCPLACPVQILHRHSPIGAAWISYSLIQRHLARCCSSRLRQAAAGLIPVLVCHPPGTDCLGQPSPLSTAHTATAKSIAPSVHRQQFWEQLHPAAAILSQSRAGQHIAAFHQCNLPMVSWLLPGFSGCVLRLCVLPRSSLFPAAPGEPGQGCRCCLHCRGPDGRPSVRR